MVTGRRVVTGRKRFGRKVEVDPERVELAVLCVSRKEQVV